MKNSRTGAFILLLLASIFFVSCEDPKVTVSGSSTSQVSSPTSLTLLNPTSSPSFETTPVIRVSGVETGSTVEIFTDSICSAPNLVASNISSGTSVDLTTSVLIEGSYLFYAKSTTASGISSSCSSVNLAYQKISCPTGFVQVPANPAVGTNTDFCVMAYEARAWNDANTNDSVDPGELDADGCGEVACTTGDWGLTNKAASTFEALPWRMITLPSARLRCQSLGADFDLISNPEWMTLALNLENQPGNWSGNAIGNGCLKRGNNGDTNACSYNGSDPEGLIAGRNPIASQALSNGNVIWDFSGNVWEWVNWNLDPSAPSYSPNSCVNVWVELPAFNCPALVAADYMPGNPAGILANNYNSNYGLGLITGGAAGATLRGGSFMANSSSGNFSMALFRSDVEYMVSYGFRCVYRPL